MKLALLCCQGDRQTDNPRAKCLLCKHEHLSPDLQNPHQKELDMEAQAWWHARIIPELGLGVSWMETGIFLGLTSQSASFNWQAPDQRDPISKTRKMALEE